jgi:hypothetical protein
MKPITNGNLLVHMYERGVSKDIKATIANQNRGVPDEEDRSVSAVGQTLIGWKVYFRCVAHFLHLRCSFDKSSRAGVASRAHDVTASGVANRRPKLRRDDLVATSRKFVGYPKQWKEIGILNCENLKTRESRLSIEFEFAIRNTLSGISFAAQEVRNLSKEE